MSFFCSSNRFKSLTNLTISRVFIQSTKTLTSLPPEKDPFSHHHDSNTSILPIKEDWIGKGIVASSAKVQFLIKKLKDGGLFNPVLEISRLKGDQKYFVLKPGDIATRLDLISKVYGIEQVEKYFYNIPEQSRCFRVYNVLLNCYAHAKSIDKAEALTVKMRQLGFVRVSPTYHVLLRLYSKVRNYQKLNMLMEEMKGNGIPLDKFTYSICLRAYVVAFDIDGMEKILQRMEADPQVIMDWDSYAVAAKGYIKAELIEKALEMLEKSVELVKETQRRSALVVLLALYERTGRKNELYRLWDMHKSYRKGHAKAYSFMIGSLLKFDDIVGAEKIVEEWQSMVTTQDFLIHNLLVEAYCKNGLLRKAETLITRAIKNGMKPSAITWDLLATEYLEANQIPKAVETMKTAIRAGKSCWKPNRDALVACLEYLKRQCDDGLVEECVRLLGDTDSLSNVGLKRLFNLIYDKKKKGRMYFSDSDDDEELTQFQEDSAIEGLECSDTNAVS